MCEHVYAESHLDRRIQDKDRVELIAAHFGIFQINGAKLEVPLATLLKLVVAPCNCDAMLLVAQNFRQLKFDFGTSVHMHAVAFVVRYSAAIEMGIGRSAADVKAILLVTKDEAVVEIRTRVEQGDAK